MSFSDIYSVLSCGGKELVQVVSVIERRAANLSQACSEHSDWFEVESIQGDRMVAGLT